MQMFKNGNFLSIFKIVKIILYIPTKVHTEKKAKSICNRKILSQKKRQSDEAQKSSDGWRSSIKNQTQKKRQSDEAQKSEDGWRFINPGLK